MSRYGSLGDGEGELLDYMTGGSAGGESVAKSLQHASAMEKHRQSAAFYRKYAIGFIAIAAALYVGGALLMGHENRQWRKGRGR